MTLWDCLLWLLTWLSAEPAAMEVEHPRAAAAVAAARASMTAGEPAPAPPTPPAPGPACPCEGACNGTGTWKPDGRIIKTCPGTCPCKPAK
jgi:hypothetical protein